MRFVVQPIVNQNPQVVFTTMCALCSEDPRFCPPTC